MAFRLSIIVVTKNRAHRLDRCLYSLRETIRSACADVETVIIDGGSTDGTAKVIEHHRSFIDYYVSEPDSGVSEAVNKGIAAATGDALILFSDDDELLPEGVSAAVRLFRERPELDILFAHGEIYDEDAGGLLHRFWPRQPVGKLCFRDFLRLNEIGWPTPEMSLMRRTSFQKFGGYDLQYRYLGCLNLWLRWAKAGARCEAVPIVMSKKIYNPECGCRFSTRGLRTREYYRLIWKYGGVIAMLRLQVSSPRQWRRVIASPLLVVCDYFDLHPRSFLRERVAAAKRVLGGYRVG